MILVSFFSEDNLLSDEIKICYNAIFSNLKVTKIKRSAFWGTPGIVIIVYNEPFSHFVHLLFAYHYMFATLIYKSYEFIAYLYSNKNTLDRL